MSCSKSNPVGPQPEVESDTILGSIIYSNTSNIFKSSYYYDNQKRLLKAEISSKPNAINTNDWKLLETDLFSYNNKGLISEIKYQTDSNVHTVSIIYSNDLSSAIWIQNPGPGYAHHFKLDKYFRKIEDSLFVDGMFSGMRDVNIYDSLTDNLNTTYQINNDTDTLTRSSYYYDDKKNPFRKFKQADFYMTRGSFSANNILYTQYLYSNGNISRSNMMVYTYNNLNFPSKAVELGGDTTSLTFDYIK